MESEYLEEQKLDGNKKDEKAANARTIEIALGVYITRRVPPQRTRHQVEQDKAARQRQHSASKSYPPPSKPHCTRQTQYALRCAYSAPYIIQRRRCTKRREILGPCCPLKPAHSPKRSGWAKGPAGAERTVVRTVRLSLRLGSLQMPSLPHVYTEIGAVLLIQGPAGTE